jgi:CAAX prenyl protease-like protein
MLLSMLEPSFPNQAQDILTPAGSETGLEGTLSEADRYALNERRSLANRYLLVYGLKVVVTTAFLVFFWRSYVKQFPVSATWWSLVAGIVGIVLWVGLCYSGLEAQLADWLGFADFAYRSRFDPFTQLHEPWQVAGFLAIRFFGLVLMVPLCEELLLRGFLMRYVESPEWWKVRLGQLSLRAMLVAPLYGLLTHPAEALAAVAWFSLVTWLVHRTGKFWDAVIAHAVTNLLLGLYVCGFGQWQLW